jgi:hypothetical protein
VFANPRDVKAHISDAATPQPQPETTEAAVAYIRRVYASTREWYAVAETKAQLLLTVNGIFVSILFGVLFGRLGNVNSSTAARFGPETWVFLGVAVAALVSALACAAGCLWSFHGHAKEEFARLGVNPDDPTTYRPEVLWYFGHLAHLQWDAIAETLRGADQNFEAETLSYNVFDLSVKVLRKHRLVNAGWALTALALIALVAAGTSFFLRAQF